MKKFVFLSLALAFFAPCLHAQKRLLYYPFQFEKSFLQRSDYNAYFLDDNANSFALVLQDNKKAEYILVDKTFKVVTKITPPIANTVFKNSDIQYVGGTAANGAYNFIYKQTEKQLLSKDKISYLVETVDFNGKTVSQKDLFQIPKDEKLLSSFSDNGRYFSITADDKASNLVFYTLAADGSVVQKVVPFKVPQGVGKDKISEYLQNLQLVKANEEPGLDLSTKDAKLFSYADKLVFTVNNKDNPTHVFTVNLNDFSNQEIFIDHTPLVPKDAKGKNYVTSFLKGGLLFELLLNKKGMTVAIYGLPNGQLLKSQEINEESSEFLFAEGPSYEQRLGKNVMSKDITDIKKVIRNFINGSEGVTVGKNKEGQYIVTIGTWDLIAMSSGSTTVGGFQPTGNTIVDGRSLVVYNPNLYHFPGSSYTSTSSRYYKSTYFKLLFDPKTFATTHGRIPRSVNDQIKDYLEEDVSKKAKATNQFTIGDSEYYGYYDKDEQQYVIEQILVMR